MLADNFYETVSYTSEVGGAKATLRLNRQSPIFNGHFPGTPIVPGVCSIQMIQELLEKATSKKFMLTGADNIKFLGIINPDEIPEIDVELTFKQEDQGAIAVSATIAGNGNVLLKFKGRFKC